MTHTILLDGKLCPKCKTPLAEARGIGPYCPNAKCDIIDNIAPVKEEKLCKSPTCGDHTDHFRGEGRCEARQPVPSEQEKQEEYEDLTKRLHSRIRGTDQEYIICAAVHFESNKVQAHQPKNITHGLVVCGRRHHNCFATVATFDVKLKEIEEGFVTSKDRFVNREEAGEIAHKAGQTTELKACLFSEDIY